MEPGDGQLSLELFPPEADVPGPDEGQTPARNAKREIDSSPQVGGPLADVAGDATGRVSDGPALLTTREAAEVLHVHPRTVQRLVERGELSVVRLGSAVRFDPFDLGGLIARLKRRRERPEAQVADSVRARSGARVCFADRLRSQQHEHRAAQA